MDRFHDCGILNESIIILEFSNPFFGLQNRNQPTRKIAKIVKNWFKVLLEAVRFGVQSVAWKLSSDY